MDITKYFGEDGYEIDFIESQITSECSGIWTGGMASILVYQMDSCLNGVSLRVRREILVFDFRGKVAVAGLERVERRSGSGNC